MNKLLLIILLVGVVLLLLQFPSVREWALCAALFTQEAQLGATFGAHEGAARRPPSGARTGRRLRRSMRCIGRQKVRFVAKDLKAHPRTKSEAAVIDILESLTGCKFPTVIMHHGDKRYELDGYCEELKLAIEYQGPLHTKWYPTQESYEVYLARVLKDEAKKRACEKVGINLITIDMSQHGPGLRSYLESRLADFGLRPRPVDYVPEKIVVPFRNPQLERELSRERVK